MFSRVYLILISLSAVLDRSYDRFSFLDCVHKCLPARRSIVRRVKCFYFLKKSLDPSAIWLFKSRNCITENVFRAIYYISILFQSVTNILSSVVCFNHCIPALNGIFNLFSIVYKLFCSFNLFYEAFVIRKSHKIIYSRLKIGSCLIYLILCSCVLKNVFSIRENFSERILGCDCKETVQLKICN